MMFIVRTKGERPRAAGVDVKLGRATPAIVGQGEGKADFFCVAEADALAALRASGWTIVELHDGYYEDGRGGGVGIWGQGRYWEIRDSHFTIREAVGPSAPASPNGKEGEQVNVRGAIFGV